MDYYIANKGERERSLFLVHSQDGGGGGQKDAMHVEILLGDCKHIH